MPRAIRERSTTQILDAAAVGRLLVEVFGSQKKAAAALKVDQRTVNRMCNGAVGAISQSTLRRIRKGLPPDRVSAFDRLILSPRALLLLSVYRFWIHEKLCSATRLVTAESFWKRGENEVGGPTAAELQELVIPEARATLMADRILPLLLESELLGGLFDGFIEWASKRRVYRPRIYLALWRVIEPLVEAIGCEVETSLEDLIVAGRIDRYLSLALEREKLLLHRGSDVERARQVAATPKKALLVEVVRQLGVTPVARGTR